MFEYVHDHNRFLKGLISQIKEEGLNDTLLHALCVELRFAHLSSVNFRGSPLYLKRDGKVYLILFADFDEMMSYFPNWTNSNMSFDWYLEILKSPAYYYYIEDGNNDIHHFTQLTSSDGILFISDDEEFIIEGELLGHFNEYFKINVYDVDDLKAKYDTISNTRLERLLNQNPPDWDEIIPEIGKSTMLFLFDLNEENEFEEIDLVFDFLRFDLFGFNHEITLHTRSDLGDYHYAAIVSFKNAADHTVKFGLSGLTFKTPAGDVFMTRATIIDKYELIEQCCDDERLKQSHECLFKL